MTTMSEPEDQTNTTTFTKYIKVPARIISFAMDNYVKSLTGCGTNIAFGNTMGCPTPHMLLIPKSPSVNSPNGKFRTVDEDLPELIRMSSRGKIKGGEGSDKFQRSISLPANVAGRKSGGPSKEVELIGTIDEERDFDEFVNGEEDGDNSVGLLKPNSKAYARSKSCAMVSKNKVV